VGFENTQAKKEIPGSRQARPNGQAQKGEDPTEEIFQMLNSERLKESQELNAIARAGS
jgi:hypothetical protein